MKRLTGLLAVGALLIAPAYGYLRLSFSYGNGTSALIARTNATAIPFFVNSLIAPGLQSSATGTTVTVIASGSNPTFALQSAQAAWNGITTSAARFAALGATTKVIDPTDNQNTIAVGSTAADLSALGYVPGVYNGALAITANTGASFLVGSMPTGDIADSDIIINPAYTFSTDGSTSADLQAVMTHEFGHSLGLNHSGLLGATMFQYVAANARYLSSDEIGFASAVYPAKGVALGTISGKVVAGDGSAVQSALVEMIDTANGNALSALTGSDGSYSVEGAPGSYVVYAEPITSSSVVQAGNLYLPTTAVVTSNFQPTVLGGLSSPTQIALTAGAGVTVPNLTVTAGSSSLTPPYAGIGAAGASGDIHSIVGATPFVVPSGQSVDIGLIGGGIDGTVSITAIGQGISVHAGSLRVDSKEQYSGILTGLPFVRVTLDIAAHQTPSLASLIITKGSSVLAMSGVLILVPPTPVFTSNAVVNAASYLGNGVVSPGGISSIYDTAHNSLGPNPYVQNTAYDIYGNLPTSAGNVSVTFDGAAAPIYFAYAGQLNVQVPFEVAGKSSTQVVVNYYGSKSAPVAVTVASAQPTFFTFTAEGKDAIIQNFPDYSLNNANNPIARGGVAILYGTGIGKLSYALATGQPGIVPPSSYVSAYSCSFGGQTASAYGYWNYGFVGEATWTVTVPSNSPTGAVALTCTDSVSGASTQPATIYVK
jgi:uncharacterized protein (TIGR03437 family)